MAPKQILAWHHCCQCVTSGTVKKLVLPNNFDLVVNRFAVDNPVFEDYHGEESDVGNNDDDDDGNDDFVDDGNKENVKPVWLSPELEGDNQSPPVQLWRSNGVPFEELGYRLHSVTVSMFV